MCTYDSRCACDDADDDFVGQLLLHIAQGSWGVTGVWGDASGPPFAYTTGLTGLGRPELIIVGPNPALGGRLLNTVASRLIDAPELGAGSRLSRVIQHFDVAMVEVSEQAGMDEQLATLLIYGRVPSLQVVLPDSRGRFPWVPGYSMSPLTQPLWGLPPGPFDR